VSGLLVVRIVKGLASVKEMRGLKSVAPFVAIKDRIKMDNKCFCKMGWLYEEFCPFCNKKIPLELKIEEIKRSEDEEIEGFERAEE
jgi:hypothetical protein